MDPNLLEIFGLAREGWTCAGGELLDYVDLAEYDPVHFHIQYRLFNHVSCTHKTRGEHLVNVQFRLTLRQSKNYEVPCLVKLLLDVQLGHVDSLRRLYHAIPQNDLYGPVGHCTACCLCTKVSPKTCTCNRYQSIYLSIL